MNFAAPAIRNEMVIFLITSHQTSAKKKKKTTQRHNSIFLFQNASVNNYCYYFEHITFMFAF